MSDTIDFSSQLLEREERNLSPRTVINSLNVRARGQRQRDSRSSFMARPALFRIEVAVQLTKITVPGWEGASGESHIGTAHPPSSIVGWGNSLMAGLIREHHNRIGKRIKEFVSI